MDRCRTRGPLQNTWTVAEQATENAGLCQWPDTVNRSLFTESLGGDHANDSTAMLLRRCFHFADFAERLDHHLHDLAAFLDVGHFTSAEQDADLHFVFVLQELSPPRRIFVRMSSSPVLGRRRISLVLV